MNNRQLVMLSIRKSGTNLGIIFGIPGMKRNGLKVKRAVKIHGGESGDSVLESGNDVMCCCSRVRRTRVNGTCDVREEEGPVVVFGVTVTGTEGVEGRLGTTIGATCFC